MGKRRQDYKLSAEEADDRRADAGKTTREALRYGLPAYWKATRSATHQLKGYPGVRFVPSEEDDRLWGVLATRGIREETRDLLPTSGDTVEIVDRTTGREQLMFIDEAELISECYYMISLKRPIVTDDY